MTRAERNRRRELRKEKKLRGRRIQAERLRATLKAAEACPGLAEFIASMDTSSITRLLGVFCCSPNEYLQTEGVLAARGYPGYEVLQCEIEGERTERHQNGPRGWAAAVKRAGEQDSQFKIFVGIVQRPPADEPAEDMARRWGEIVAVAHELGHADDMQNRLHFPLNDSLDLVAAEVHAHRYACHLLAEQEQIMGLAAYLAIGVCPIANDSSTSASTAAREFMQSNTYKASYARIPSHMRGLFGLIE